MLKTLGIFIVAIVLLNTNIACEMKSYSQNNSIVGTWLENDEGKLKMVFTQDNKCYQYFEGELIETDTYIISITSPQCGLPVTLTDNTSFLQLTDTDGGNKTCYEINGVLPKTLSIRELGKGENILFNRK